MTAEQLRREFDAAVLWLPFHLHPEYPVEGIPLADLHRRYGFGPVDPMRDRFAAAGLDYNRPEIVPQTLTALRVTELARERGLHDAFHDRLMAAYWSEAANVGDAAELVRLAGEVGLDGGEVERVIEDPSAYLEPVAASTAQAQQIGINAIPAFVLDRKLIVLGAQPIETFRQAFAQLDADDYSLPG